MTDAPSWIAAARDKWTNRGQQRPPFAIEPGPGQESVWDYPRPPALVNDGRRVVVTASGDPMSPVLADSTTSLRVLETASPPTFYLPPSAVDHDQLVEVGGSSHCEWKGPATYFVLAADARTAQPTPVAWTYRSPYTEFAAIRDHVSFYPGRVHCMVGDDIVAPQAGGFYGGWITPEVVGPFKGDPGTSGW